MKLKNQIAMLTALAALAGCDRNDQTQSPSQSDTPAAPDTAITAPGQSTAKPHTTDGKNEFIAATDTKFRELDAKIDDLAKKAEGYKDDAKAQADKALAELREQRDKAKVKFEEVKKASAETWKDVKAGFASAMDELEKAFDNVKSKFN